MSVESEWPDPDIHIGQKEHLHALGVIIARYNVLEFKLLIFFMRYLKLQPEPAQRLFVLLANPSRIDVVRDAVEQMEKDQKSKEC